MRVFLLIVLIQTISINIFSQDIEDNETPNNRTTNIALFFKIGISVPQDNQISDIYPTGYNVSFGSSLNIIENTLFVEPSIEYLKFQKHTGAEYSTKDNTSIVSFSIPFLFRIYRSKTGFYKGLFLRGNIDYNYVKNYISLEIPDNSTPYYYNSSSNSLQKETIMKGAGFSFGIGLRYNILERLAIDADYIYMPLTLTLEQDISTNFKNNGIITEDAHKFNFSMIQIKVLYRFIIFK